MSPSISSSKLLRTRRLNPAIPNIDKVRVGSSRWTGLVFAPAGSQRSSTAKIWMRSMPSQNAGADCPNAAKPCKTLAIRVERNCAAHTPRGMPTSQLTRKADRASSTVAGMRWTINVVTGHPDPYDLPRSPCTAAAKNRTYCSNSVLSSPRASLRRARSSGVASTGNRRFSGLPDRRLMRNTMRVRTSSASTP